MWSCSSSFPLLVQHCSDSMLCSHSNSLGGILFIATDSVTIWYHRLGICRKKIWNVCHISLSAFERVNPSIWYSKHLIWKTIWRGLYSVRFWHCSLYFLCCVQVSLQWAYPGPGSRPSVPAGCLLHPTLLQGASSHVSPSVPSKPLRSPSLSPWDRVESMSSWLSFPSSSNSFIQTT